MERRKFLQNTGLFAAGIYFNQAKAIADVKKDMEAAAPMDRLVCGDVGFGKTEVAVRAAFKAAIDGKQVAVLVPTTILAFQHFKTFTDRLNDFPVTIDFLNRFKIQSASISEKLKFLKSLCSCKYQYFKSEVIWVGRLYIF